MTATICNGMCQGFKYFGLQAGGECYCGNDYGNGKAPETECNSPCTGASGEICGGNLRNSIYAVTAPTAYSCDAATGQCAESRNGTLSAEACIDGCKAPMFSCNATIGKCVEDPSGTQTAQSCIGSCECVVPHNCGQLNGTMQCGVVLAGCNVCDACCQPWLTKKSECDGCFNTNVTRDGCGGK
jgi:hypothetical protein